MSWWMRRQLIFWFAVKGHLWDKFFRVFSSLLTIDFFGQIGCMLLE
uniref:Uncharacterized protein n=1 Tax=Anopheles minimus TaxID=112268 RepID=A0A182WQ48_9DIPT